MQPVPERLKSVLQWLFKPRPVVILGLVVGAVLVISSLAAMRTQRALKLQVASQQSVQVAGPLEVTFNQEIAPDFKAAIEPAISGKWHYDRTMLGVSGAKFTPDNRFEAGQTYTLRLTGLKRFLTGASVPDVTQRFTAQHPAAIKSTSPTGDAKDMPTKPRITVELATANRGVRDLVATLSPAAPLKLVSSDDTRFIWEPETPLKQGTTYTFELNDQRMAQPEKRRLVTFKLTTVTAPAITAARTGDHFTPGQTVDITFDQPMQPSDQFFSFGLKGKGSWVNDRTYRFQPEGLKPGTTYTYTVKAGAQTAVGGALEADRSFQFATNGAVTASTSPGGGDLGLGTSIRIAFDQAVDHDSAQSRFSMSPAVPGKFSWSGNTMIYTPNGLSYQTTYTYSVAPGVVPSWGLPSARAFSGSFSTAPQTIKLSVPLFKQTYGNGCQLTALRMLLAYRGIGTTEWDIVQRIGYNPRNRDTATNSWDNPNVTFVGFLNGYQNTTGYGVHAGPIAAAGRTYGHNTVAYYGVSPQFIAARVHEGNPVAFWGHSTPAKADSWNTPNGVIPTWLSAHARVVYGVVGSPDAPIGFWINDSWKGNTFYWTAAQLAANMNVIPGVSNQAVVVY